MSDITARPQDFALAEPTRAKSRGYWQRCCAGCATIT